MKLLLIAVVLAAVFSAGCVLQFHFDKELMQ